MLKDWLPGGFGASALLVVSTAGLSAQGTGFTPEDYYRLTQVGEVAMSPIGDMVAFTVTTVVEAENRRHREIWLQPLADGEPDGTPFRVTSPTEESTEATWSPDGSLLSFKSRRGEDSNEIWFLRMGGRGGEAFHLAGVNSRPWWSPDGTSIAFVREPGEEGDEPLDRQSDDHIAPDAVSRTLDSERFDGTVITSMRYKRDGVSGFLAHPSTAEKRQLFVVPAAGGDARQATHLGFDVGTPVWSVDGLHLYFQGDEAEDDEYAEGRSGDLWMAATSGGGVRQLTDSDGSESQPRISPDGARIAYLQSDGRGAPTDVMVAELGTDGAIVGEAVNVTETWDLIPGGLRWGADALALTWTARIGGNIHVFKTSATGGDVVQVTTGERQLRGVSFSADDRVLAYTATDAARPAELFVARADGSGETRSTSFNDAFLAERTLMSAERLTWAVADGTEIEGWVIKPVGHQPGQSYPLILKIHGGPHGAYGNTFFPTFHVLSAAGFFVLYTNPRGSSGYGNDFEYATREQWGIMDKEDYLKGVDAALERYPEADATRLGVSGGSYGGFMSNWLTATTDRFQAAVTSRSISNWDSWWGTSDVPGLTEYEFGGTPWERRDLYRRLSPLSYVENVTAPTLIIHSEEDFRTPMQDAEQWYLSLKKLRVPTELVRYPRSSHGLSRSGEPWLLVDRLERLRSWFSHFLIDEEGVTAAQ